MLLRIALVLLLSVGWVNGYCEIHKCKDRGGHITYTDEVCGNKESDISTDKTLAIPNTDSGFWERLKTKLSSYLPFQNKSPTSPSLPTTIQMTTPDNRYTCDGRTSCSQMTSCEEATFFIQHCPGTAMDGDNDGIPCERQWCR